MGFSSYKQTIWGYLHFFHISKFLCVPHVFLGRIGLPHLEAPAARQLLRHGEVLALGVLQEDQGEVVLLTVDANEGAVTWSGKSTGNLQIN